MYTILLVNHQPGLIDSINHQLSMHYDIDPQPINTIMLHDLPYRDGYHISHLDGTIFTDYYGLKSDPLVTYVDDITDSRTIADYIAGDSIDPVVYFTDDLSVASQWLDRFSTYDIVAVDFESKDLTLPQFNPLTMCTIGWSLHQSAVFVFSTKQMENLILQWLVTTDVPQVYHNSLFDARLIHYLTKRLPKHIEDSQLLAQVYNNHVNPAKRTSGLKEIAGPLYRDWASSKSSFDLYDTSLNHTVTNLHYVSSHNYEQTYNLALIKYCGIDQCATRFAWDKYNFEQPSNTHLIRPTSEPRDNLENFNQRDYYEYILKPSLPILVKMVNAGQHIDLSQVDTLHEQIISTRDSAIEQITSYPVVQQFQSAADSERIEKFLAPVRKSWVHPKFTGYVNNVAMRTWVINFYSDLDVTKVTATDLKHEPYASLPVTQLLLDKHYQHPAIVCAANAFAVDKAYQQNLRANRIDKMDHPEKYIDIGFNPYNYSQLTQMWIALGLESDETSKKTGLPSFSTPILRDLADTVTDPDIANIIRLYLSISESKNLITQYIPKYYGSTVDGRVYGSIRALGTISGRLSGKSAKMDGDARHRTGINLVTQPASNPIFGSTVKRMFTAPPGRILISSDYSNLEGNVGAILTKDATSLRNLKQNFDT